MGDKFSYYDFLVNFVPGAFLFWAIVIALSPVAGTHPLPTSNLIVDSAMFAVLAYTLGHLVQFAAQHTVEPVLKRLFWSGAFFSEWLLVKGRGGCSESARRTYVDIARHVFGLSEGYLSALDLSDATDRDLERAREVSQAVYQRFDSYAADHGLAAKATIQNAFYAFFRGTAFVSAAAGLLLVVVGAGSHGVGIAVLGAASFLSSVPFAVRARERGELYVRGVFDSVAAHVVAMQSSH